MAERRTLPPRSEGREESGFIERFALIERAVHWANALLFGILMFTGLALYWTPLIGLIGNRELVVRIHLYAGLCLPVPVILALSGRWGRALRADIRRFNRWSAADRDWLRSSTEERAYRRAIRARLPVGKFNAGQKLNAAWTAGAGLVMLGTGVILRWYRPFSLSIRQGATFVHDWLAVFIVLVVIGHIAMAISDREALKSMVLGRISRAWAAIHAPGWLAEIDGTDKRGRRREPAAAKRD